MTETATKQITIRVTDEIDALINAAAKRRRTKKNQWIKDSINLALDLETGARS
jgi:uncharacterized protein (DUF1778 family)